MILQLSVHRFPVVIYPCISMLRISTKRLPISGLRSVRMQGTQNTTTLGPKPPKSRSKLGRKILFTLGTLVSVTGSVIGYAYVDPNFRLKVETTVPQTKPVFDAILSSSSLSTTKKQLASVKDQIISALPKKKHEEVLPPLPKIPYPEPQKSLVHVDPVDIKMPPDAVAVKPNYEDVTPKIKELESALLSAIQSAETLVRNATRAKFETIGAINEHAQLVKLTVDEPQKADWEKVTLALQHAESLSHKDRLAEIDGRNSIDGLRKIIKQGKNDPSTSKSPLLINATETANKLSHELDELDGLVSKARQEAAILNQYKDLIERSRNQFALEMKSILPNVDINEKAKKLTEEELNALIAHAHLKVDHLRRQLSEQQVREEQNIARAIADQREADERIAVERMLLELENLKRQHDVEVEKAVMNNRSQWEAEMEEQLKRATAAHSEHLEQVIRTQRQLFEIEHSQKVEEAIKLERDIYSRQVGAALSRLEGIESALSNRIALDSENRRAKQFWIACHNLIESIKYGNKAGDDLEKRRFPLEKSLLLLKQCECEDAFVDNLISSFPEVSKKEGVYTEQDLKSRFNKIYKLGRRTAAIGENGGTPIAYLWSYLRSLLFFDVIRNFTYDDVIDPYSIDNFEILARAKWYVDQDDFSNAVRIAQLLRGEPARAIRDWLVDTRAYMETLLLARLLMAHAAVSSIRSTY